MCLPDFVVICFHDRHSHWGEMASKNSFNLCFCDGERYLMSLIYPVSASCQVDIFLDISEGEGS